MERLEDFVKNTDYSFEKMMERFPFMMALRDTPQNPEYHGEGNVYNHTKLVCESLYKADIWKTLSDKERYLVFTAAFFHDISKETCTKIEKNEITSPNHAVYGGKKFREICYRNKHDRFQMDFSDREHVANLIRYHGLPLWFLEKNNTELWVRKASCQLNLKLLYALAKADVCGREAKDKNKLLDKVEYFKEYCTELNCFEKPSKFDNGYTKMRYFLGKMNWYGNTLYDDASFDVYMMAGLPLSGKDTYIANNLSNLPVISLDEIRELYKISPTQNQREVINIANKKAKEYLREKQPFVWNATNLIKENRQRLYNLFENYGARVNVIYLEAKYETLLERNLKRKRKVPVEVIKKMIKKMDMIEPWEATSVKYFTTIDSENLVEID